MIISAFLSALGQIGDRRFLRVMMLGIGLSVILLCLVYAAFIHAISWMVPETIFLPWGGQITWVDTVVSWGSLVLMMALSVFLMVPVAALFSGLFIDEVARAVEMKHYPTLPPARAVGLYESVRSAVNFFGVLIAVNAVALLLYFVVGPFAPLMFWAVNGYLLGREFFETVAARRLDPAQARAMRKANAGTIWLAGVLMAAPLSFPLVNLVVPVLAVATFTHLFHGLSQRQWRQGQRGQENP